jgi:hypothetical protein
VCSQSRPAYSVRADAGGAGGVLPVAGAGVSTALHSAPERAGSAAAQDTRVLGSVMGDEWNNDIPVPNEHAPIY